MLLAEAVNDYLLSIRHERGLSKNTVLHYQSNLRALLRWLGENGFPEPTVEALNTPTLRRYLYAMSARGLRPRSIHTAFHGIKGLCAFLVEHGGLPAHPCATLTLPKKDAAECRTVSDEEITRLLEACERQSSPRQVALYRAVLSALVYGGLRRAECCDLQVEDIDLKDGSILVRQGKGRKSRRVFICREGVDALREWLAVREKDTKHEWLFSLDRNRRMHFDGIASMLTTLKATAGLRDHSNIVPHALRHACATRLLRNGADLKSLQVFLGHSSLTVTAVYCHSSEEQLRSIAHLGALQPAAPPHPPAPEVRAEGKRYRRVRSEK